jgi:hypothetical protein
MTKKQDELEIAVSFTKAELEELEFYLRWSDKLLFGNYQVGREERVVVRNISRKARTALAVAGATSKAEVARLEKMLGLEEGTQPE